jgi:hypothetical protein
MFPGGALLPDEQEMKHRQGNAGVAALGRRFQVQVGNAGHRASAPVTGMASRFPPQSIIAIVEWASECGECEE